MAPSSHTLSNRDIVRMFREMELLYNVKGVRFKPQAYGRARDTIAELDRNVCDIYKEEGVDGLKKLPHIGKGIAEHIIQVCTKGVYEEFELLKKEIPVDVIGLTSIEGIGPQTVKTLYTHLGIQTVDDLERALQDNQIQTLPGFGKKSEANIAEGVRFFRESEGRFQRAYVADMVEDVRQTLLSLKGVSECSIVGSCRRKKDTIGDIDIVLTVKKPDQPKVINLIEALSFVTQVYESGEKNIRLRITQGIDVDIHLVSEESHGAALIECTGSHEHVKALRSLAHEKGYSFDEYGVRDADGNVVAQKSEEDVYRALGLSYIEPELREGEGEIEAAMSDALPQLIVLSDMRGDLQMHTQWSDGVGTIEERARNAFALGYEYIAITDHTQSLRMTNGLDDARLREYMKEIDAVNEMLQQEGITFHVLKSAEVNIAKDGTLDVSDDVLSELDFASAAIHSYFDLSVDEQTYRLVRAIEHPSVRVINHPTSRLINKRRGISIDFAHICRAACKHNVALEIDAQPDRLDLPYPLIKIAREEGVRFTISSDAHSHAGMSMMRHGIDEARRGWIQKKDVINTQSLEEVRRFFGIEIDVFPHKK